MANNLTGDFEGVVQLSIRQIDGLLATLHQNGVQDDAAMKLLHSASLRVGDHRRFPGDFGAFGDWLRELGTIEASASLDHLRGQLVGAVPPGAARRIEHEFSQFGRVPEEPPPPETVRGTVKLQLASATLSLPAGSSSEVMVHVQIRARYYPDAGTAAMPEPVHGEAQITFEILHLGSRLLIQPSSQDSKIQFIPNPGAGLSPADTDRIAAQVRNAVRQNISVLPVDLPSGFPFSAFKGLGTGTGQALALPLNLSNTSLPTGNVQSVNTLFIGSSGFAVAVSKEFLKSVFQPTINSLLQFKQDFVVTVLHFFHPTYHFVVTSVDLQFNNGSIDLIIKGKATTTYPLAPSYDNIVVTQRFTLVLFLDTLFLPARDEDLTISGLPGAAVDRVRLAAIAARDQALPPAVSALNQQLSDAKNRLATGLHSFDPSASVSFRLGTSEQSNANASGAVAVTPDGVILRGDITGARRLGPIMDIRETEQGQAFTALNTWIPGGRIDRMIWSWVEYAGAATSIFSGVVKSATEEHRFVFPKPSGVTELSRICLRIEGTQTLANGSVVNVAGGAACHLPDYGQVMEVPSWWEPVTVPAWFPDMSEGAVLRESIAAHISVQAETPRTSDLTHNTLIYFPDWQADQPLDVLIRGLEHMRRKSYSLVVIVVLPAGTFDGRRREIEGRFHSFEKRFPARLWLTEDNQCGWTRTFAVVKFPSTCLIDARGKFVWKYENNPGAGVLANALDKDLLPAPAPRFKGLRLAVSPGECAPDVTFEDDQAHPFALHRMRGRQVLLNFWQSWSAPCLKELQRLQQLHARGGEHGPVVIAFHGGKDRQGIEDTRKQLGLTFPLVHDAEQRIGRMYGVRCWPTTMSLNADGLVDHVQFGFMPASAKPPAPEKEKAV